MAPISAASYSLILDSAFEFAGYNAEADTSLEKHFSLGNQGPQITAYRRTGSCLQPAAIPSLRTSEVHIWEFPLTLSECEFPACLEMLSEDERTRAAKFRFEKHSRRFVVARASMRSILAEYTRRAPPDLHFHYSKYGKPSLGDDAEDIRFNLSHAGERALLAIARACDVGIDIEAIREDIECEKLAERFFSAKERESLWGLPAEKKVQSFFRIWTCKEAFLKAQGFGLTRSLDSFDIELAPGGGATLLATRPDAAEAERWSLIELETSREYAAAAAMEGKPRLHSVFRYG